MSSGPTNDESGRTASPAPGARPAQAFGAAPILFIVGASFALAQLIEWLTHSHTVLMLVSSICMFGGVFFQLRANKRRA
jgi:hypothetical protein